MKKLLGSFVIPLALFSLAILSLVTFEGAPFAEAAYTWTQRAGAGVHNWSSMTSSADGTRIYATDFGGYIYTSIDGGITWEAKTNAGRWWYSVASSADGMKLVAGAMLDYIYTSVDGGNTWVARTNSGSYNWMSVASSADGMRLVGVTYGGYIYVSTNGGETWEKSGSPGKWWYSVASSADGMRLTAVDSMNVYLSNDGGKSWIKNDPAGERRWISVVSSSDGMNLAAADYTGYIYTSNDRGNTWVPNVSLGTHQWSSLASSADGTKYVVGTVGNKIYTSIDSGKNWVEETSFSTQINWRAATISSNGKVMAVGGMNDYIYTRNNDSTIYPGTVNVITRINGRTLTSAEASKCVATVIGPNGGNTAGCVRTLTNQPAGTYTIKWENGYPAGADTTKIPTVSPVRFLGDRPAGENPVTFYVDFAVKPVASTSATITSGTQSTSLTPVISGTATGITQVGIVLSNSGGKVYGSGLIPVTNGTWLTTVSPGIAAGNYTVVVYNANNVKLTSGSLTVLTPTYPGTVNVITRLGNWPVSSAGTCVSTLSGPNGSNTGGCVRSLTNQPAGTYTLKWNGGYPAGADTTKTPTVSPVRFLGDRPAGENPITFYVDFASSTGSVVTPSAPTVSIISRLNGRVLSTNEVPITCNVSLSTPKGIFPGPCSRTVTSSGVGTYAIRWSGSFPTGADTTKRPTVTSAQTLGTNNLVFYVDFAATPVAQPTLGIAFVSANTSVSSGTQSNDDVGTFQIKYKIAAVGGDIYIPSNIASALNYVVDRAGVPVNSSVISATLTNDTDSTVTTMGNYVVEDGTQEIFTLTVTMRLGGTYTAGQYRTSLTGIKWGAADDTTPEHTYTNLDGFKTSYVGLNLEDIQNPANKSAFTASLLDALKGYIFGR